MHGKGKGQGEAIATVFEEIREKDPEGRDKFCEYSASEVDFLRQRILRNHRVIIRNLRKEIRNLDPPGDRVAAGRRNTQIRRGLDGIINFQQIVPGRQVIDDFVGILASDQTQNVRNGMRTRILPYKVCIYRRYANTLRHNIENRN